MTFQNFLGRFLIKFSFYETFVILKKTLFLGVIRPETYAELVPHLESEQKSPYLSERRNKRPAQPTRREENLRVPVRLSGRRQVLQEVQNLPNPAVGLRPERNSPEAGPSHAFENKENDSALPAFATLFVSTVVVCKFLL